MAIESFDIIIIGGGPTPAATHYLVKAGDVKALEREVVAMVYMSLPLQTPRLRARSMIWLSSGAGFPGRSPHIAF